MNKLKCFVLLLCINEINTPCILKSDDCPVISYTMYVFFFFGQALASYAASSRCGSFASSHELEAWLLRSATPDSMSLQTERSSASQALGVVGDFSGSVNEGAWLPVPWLMQVK